MEPMCEDGVQLAQAARDQMMGMQSEARFTDKICRSKPFTAIRKHELILLAENIVEQVIKAGVKDRERCFLNDQVQLLLRDS